MNREEAISYIEAYGWSAMKLGLGRTRELLQKLGDPQKKLHFVHVTGSNGKGSVCAMTAHILKEAGYRTGLYTSPYLEDFCERIQVDEESIPGDALGRITERVKAFAEAMEDHPSQFELVTAIAMEYFYETACDIVVLEVGMGGTFDSTNAIDAPEVAVITNVGLEHTEYLGDTLEKIAQTKGGIIKTGCTAVCYDGAPAVSAVIRQICEERKVPLRHVESASLKGGKADLDGQHFSYRGKRYRLGLLGPHQIHNAATVLEIVEALTERGWKIPEKAVRNGLKTAKWPARFEILDKDPLFILDGGHNPQCAEAMAASLRALLRGKKVLFLAGVLSDKDYPEILRILKPFAGEFICVTPASPRALSAEDFAEAVRKLGIPAQTAGSIAEGVALAREKGMASGLPVVAFGSLYLAGGVRTVYRSYRDLS